MKKLYVFILIFCASFSLRVQAQLRPVYSNYLFNGLIINPAYAGQADALSVTLDYRNQWAGSNGPQTFTASAHTPLVNKHIATGLIISYDKNAQVNTTEFLNSYAYRFKVKHTSISLGAQIGYSLAQNNLAEVDHHDQGDYVFANNITTGTFKYGLGIYISNKNYFIGASLLAGASLSPKPFQGDKYPLLNDQQFYYGGYNFFVGDNLVIKPSVLLKNVTGSPIQADLNLFFNFYKRFNIGASYRPSAMVVFMGLLQVNKQLSVGYSYDYTTSSNYLGSTHEVLLRYDFRYFVKEINHKTFK